MAISIDDTLPAMVKFQLPGCGDGLIIQKGREVAEDFFRRSTAFRQDLAAIPTVADQAQYTLTPPTDCIIGAVTKVEVDETEIHHSRYSFNSDSTLEFTTAPTESGKNVVISIVVYPGPDCISYPDEVITRWKRALADGVLAALKIDPISARSPVKWFDQMGASRYLERYENAVFKAHDEMITERKSNPVMMDVPYFA